MKGKKIMIVEDDAFVSDIYETKFSHEGCEVVVAEDGAMALEKIRDGLVPDIILLDLAMPNMNGWEFLKAAKELTEIKSVPILVLSNFSQKEDIDESLALGACGYIVKAHMTPSDVFRRVEEVLVSR